MEKIFNNFSIAIGTIGGLIVSFLGGWDGLAILLVSFMGLDYITGVLKAIYNKELSSEIRHKRNNTKSANTYSSRYSSTLRNKFRSSSSTRNSNDILYM